MHPFLSELVNFDPGHLDGAVALSRQAGWPHRLDDWRMALELSRGVAALDEAGQVVGTAFVTPYGSTFATVNMVIVDATRRGQGLGRRLMQTALDIAGDRSLYLIATAEGVPIYEKLGFRAGGQVVQHHGVVERMDAPDGVAVVLDPDLEALGRLDRQAFGADRADLIRILADVGRFAERREGAKITGFAALRPFGRGKVVGPVVAACAEDAQALIGFWIAQSPGTFLRVDTFFATGLSSWLESLGLVEVGRGMAMRRGEPAPLGDRSTVSTYALANQALG